MKCNKCLDDKDKSDFKGKVCKDCINERRRSRYKESPKTQEEQKGRAMKRQMEIRQKLDKIKESTPCVDCGHTFPSVCMDFDHKEGTKKDFSIARGACRGYSLDRLEKEIKKCDLVCSNCHRMRTFKRSRDKSQYY